MTYTQTFGPLRNFYINIMCFFNVYCILYIKVMHFTFVSHLMNHTSTYFLYTLCLSITVKLCIDWIHNHVPIGIDDGQQRIKTFSLSFLL